MNASQTELTTVIEHLESEYNFLFSYKNEVVEKIKVTPPSRAKNIQSFLSKTLKNSNLDFEIVENKYILLSQKETVSILEKEVIMLCGKVVNAQSKEALIGANIFSTDGKLGAFTDETGNFTLSIADTDKTFVVSFIGFEEQTFSALDFLKNPCFTVTLNYANFSEDNLVVVTEYLTDGVILNDNKNHISLQPEKIGTLPGQVEPDVLNTIQFLPGINSPDGSASNICIRGGTSDQNLVLWEDIPVYHTAHYFGMISAFNPYIIDEAEIYRGGFSAEYGGRVSGVIDLKSQDILNEKAKIGAGINMVNPYVYGKIPLLKNKASIVFSARRSMAEIWRSPTYESITRRINQGVLLNIPIRDEIPVSIDLQNDFQFFDSNIKSTYQFTKKDKISLAYFYGVNNFDSQITDNQSNKIQKDSIYLKNSGFSISLQHDWSVRFSTQLTGLTTDYHYDYDYGLEHFMDNRPNNFGLKNSAIKEQQIRLSNAYKTTAGHELKMGIDLINYDVDYLIQQTRGINIQVDTIQEIASNLQVLHGAFNSSNDKKTGINIGGRINHFQKTNKFYLEPRLLLWYSPNKSVKLQAHAGKYYQFLSQLVEISGDNNAGIETPIWTLAGNPEIPVLNANQVQIGLIYDKNKWLIDGQIYFKKTKGLTSLATGFSTDVSPNDLLGSSKIRGFDLLLKKRWDKLRTWVSYTLSKNDYFFPRFFDKEFAAPNDQRHIFNLATSYNFGQFKCSLGWRFATGRPYSLSENFEVRPAPESGPGNFNISPGIREFNSGRLPNEHRLNATISYTILPKNGDWQGNIGLSLFNIYNQNNVYSRTFFIDAKGMMQPPVLTYTNRADMGFTPNFVMRVEF